jgi:hypothetical protein
LLFLQCGVARTDPKLPFGVQGKKNKNQNAKQLIFQWQERKTVMLFGYQSYV